MGNMLPCSGNVGQICPMLQACRMVNLFVNACGNIVHLIARRWVCGSVVETSGFIIYGYGADPRVKVEGCMH